MKSKRKYLDPSIKCIVTGALDPDPCHVYSRKAYPQHKFDTWNIIPLAHKLHVEQHVFGWNHMIEKYPQIDQWLHDHGWELIELNGRNKLIHPIYND